MEVRRRVWGGGDREVRRWDSCFGDFDADLDLDLDLFDDPWNRIGEAPRRLELGFGDVEVRERGREATGDRDRADEDLRAGSCGGGDGTLVLAALLPLLAGSSCLSGLDFDDSGDGWSGSSCASVPPTPDARLLLLSSSCCSFLHPFLCSCSNSCTWSWSGLSLSPFPSASSFSVFFFFFFLLDLSVGGCSAGVVAAAVLLVLLRFFALADCDDCGGNVAVLVLPEFPGAADKEEEDEEAATAAAAAVTSSSFLSTCESQVTNRWVCSPRNRFRSDS